MEALKTKLMQHMTMLANEIGCRPVGTKANRAASDYIEQTMKAMGLEVEVQEFAVPSWVVEESFLLLDGERVPVKSNTFSAPCNTTGQVLSFCTIEELEAASDLTGQIALLYGELSKENYVPKGFTIYNPEHHRKTIRLLEEKNPSAIITVRMQKENDLPVMNDWDFEIPSVTVTPELGLSLINKNSSVTCVINSKRNSGKTKNIIGRISGERPEKVILTAHYDTVFDTNGAFDNASGVSVMLTLAEKISKRTDLATGFEFIAFSSEEYLGLGDDYYLKDYKETLQNALIAMNVDGVGQSLGTNNMTLMSGSPQLEERLKLIKRSYPTVQWTNPWYESNHYTFFSNGVPSIPFSSAGVSDILHSTDDTIKWMCREKLMEVCSIALEIIESVQDVSCVWTRKSDVKVTSQ